MGWQDGEVVSGGGWQSGKIVKPDWLSDVAQSALTGLKEIPEQIAGAWGDAVQAGGNAGVAVTRAAAKALGVPEDKLKGEVNVAHALGATTSADISKARQNAWGADYQPKTLPGSIAKSTVSFLPNALMGPEGVAERAAAVVLPALASEGAAAIPGVKGTQWEAPARVAGATVGGLASGLRVTPKAGAAADAALSRVVGKQDPAAMQASANAYLDAGIKPTLVDVIDDSGRGVVRAAASRMTPGRQAATDFRDARAMDLPSRMSGQAKRVMSDDARTPDQIRADMAKQRSDNADAAFSSVRADSFPMPEDTAVALRNPLGREAIAEAARRERDPDVAAMLNKLVGKTDAPITVGMADRISRTLYGRAQAATRAGDNDLAATYSGLADAVRNPAKGVSDGYRKALEGYAADSKLHDSAKLGEQLLTHNTDEFVAGSENLSDDERKLALAAGRRAVERKSGENPASAPGVARQLADAPEQQARNAALMGQERAQKLQDGMRQEERAVRNANDIAPRTGSQTQSRAQDAAETIGAVAKTGSRIMAHDWLGIGLDWLKSRGMTNEQAERIVRLSTDPAQLDKAMSEVNRTLGQRAATQFLTARRAALAGALATTGSARREEGQSGPQPAP